jgi:hypothetical protein
MELPPSLPKPHYVLDDENSSQLITIIVFIRFLSFETGPELIMKLVRLKSEKGLRGITYLPEMAHRRRSAQAAALMTGAGKRD